MNFLGLLALLVAAGVAATWCMVGADACVRSGWAYFSAAHHFAAALGLYAFVGVLLGVLASALIWLEWRLLGQRLPVRGIRSLLVRAASYGLLGALASMSTALYTFSGEHVARTLARSVGPLAFMLAAGLATAGGTALLVYGLRLERTRRGRYRAIVGAFAALGAGLVWVDLTQYVSLYFRIHTILELASALTLALRSGSRGMTPCARARAPRPRRARAGRARWRLAPALRVRTTDPPAHRRLAAPGVAR